MISKVELDLTPAENLKKSLVNKIMRKAITTASKPTYDAVKSNAKRHKRYGYLAKSFGRKAKTYKDAVVSIIGPKSKYIVTAGTYAKGKSKGQPKRYRPSFYEHFLEKGGSRYPAKPILKPALASTKDVFKQRLTDLIRKGIEAETSK